MIGRFCVWARKRQQLLETSILGILAGMNKPHDHDPLRPHSHDHNPAPPSSDPAFTLTTAKGQVYTLTPADLAPLPQSQSQPLAIVTTSHGTTGPFVFSGVTLLALLEHYTTLPDQFQVEVVSGDGFGTRLNGDELRQPHGNGPVLLSTHRDGQRLSREQGLVRLIVPSETDDALRQVKWLAELRVVGPGERSVTVDDETSQRQE